MLRNCRQGPVQVRWSAVANKQFYEIKATTGGGNIDPNIWETLPILPEGRVTKVFTGLTVGSTLSVRVRAVGSKGPSPWTEAVTLRVD